MTESELLQHMPLVRVVIKRYFHWSINQRISRRDLMQEGFFGLLQAAAEFDPLRSNFSTFACIKIRGALGKYVNAQFTPLTTKSNNFTSNPDKLTPSRRKAVFACRRCVSLSTSVVRLKRDAARIELVDPHDDIDTHHRREHAARFYRLCQQHLRPREMRVLIDISEGLSLRDIAANMGVSYQRVAGIRNRALKRIPEFWKEEQP